MSAVPKTLLTPSEYLAIERRADFKSHYYRGETFAMAGATFEHNLISANVIGELRQSLKKTNCMVVSNDMRVALDADYHYSYPDATVVCGKPEFIDDEFDTLLNPTMVVEVLSESTAAYDLSTKFDSYRDIPTLQAICFIHQDRPYLLVYARGENETWVLRTSGSLEGHVVFPVHDVRIAMQEIYRGVSFAAASSGPAIDK